MIFRVAVASIAAVIAAGAAIASAIIYWKTFQSVNAQTESSRKQLEQAESARREASRPRLTVEISEYQSRLAPRGRIRDMPAMMEDMAAKMDTILGT